MRVAVLGGAAAPVRRALEEAQRRGAVTSVTALPLSATVGDLVQAARKVDVLVAGAFDAGTIMRVPQAAVAARRSALIPSWAASDHRDHLDLDGDAKEAGITLVTGASASPAIAIALARHAARRLDEVRSVAVAWAMPPQAFSHPGAARAVLEGLTQPVLVRQDGTYSYEHAGQRERVAFPEPIGIQQAASFGGPEAWSLSRSLPGRPSVRVLMAGTLAWWPVAILPSVLLARFTWMDDAASALLSGVARLGGAGGDSAWAGLRVEVEGRQGSASATRVVGGFDRIESWDVLSMVIGLQMLARGDLEPGVSVTGSVGAPAEILSLAHDLGVRFGAFEAAA